MRNFKRALFKKDLFIRLKFLRRLLCDFINRVFQFHLHYLSALHRGSPLCNSSIKILRDLNLETGMPGNWAHDGRSNFVNKFSSNNFLLLHNELDNSTSLLWSRAATFVIALNVSFQEYYHEAIHFWVCLHMSVKFYLWPLGFPYVSLKNYTRLVL